MCTTKFMMQVLEGTKKVFHSFEIDPVNVPQNRYTGKKQFTKMIYQNKELQQYFPDDPLTQCDRQFILDVINTVDGAFFRKVMEEYEAVTLKQAAKRDKVVKLDPKMYSVLNKFNEVFMSRTAKFNLPPKKRKRHEREQWPAL